MKRLLAQYLYNIHGKMQIPGFYNWDGVTEFSSGKKELSTWESLSQTKIKPNEVYKEMFIEMADYFLKNSDIEQLLNSDKKLELGDTKVNHLAELFSKVHSYSLVPFYKIDYDPWSKLPEKSQEPNNVDKNFFRNLTIYILSRLRNSHDQSPS